MYYGLRMFYDKWSFLHVLNTSSSFMSIVFSLVHYALCYLHVYIFYCTIQYILCICICTPFF